jgi:hypothetical protein
VLRWPCESESSGELRIERATQDSASWSQGCCDGVTVASPRLDIVYQACFCICEEQSQRVLDPFLEERYAGGQCLRVRHGVGCVG